MQRNRTLRLAARRQCEKRKNSATRRFLTFSKTTENCLCNQNLARKRKSRTRQTLETLPPAPQLRSKTLPRASRALLASRTSRRPLPSKPEGPGRACELRSHPRPALRFALVKKKKKLFFFVSALAPFPPSPLLSRRLLRRSPPSPLRSAKAKRSFVSWPFIT